MPPPQTAGMKLFSLAFVVCLFAVAAQAQIPRGAEREFPKTDFAVRSIDLAEVFSGGPPRDGIPPIDEPRTVSVAEASEHLSDVDPVVGVVIGGEARAYPLRVLIWHEIANDTVAGVPVAVTYCPLCNTAIVFDRRVAGRVLDFGTTGRLRNSDLLMYDRQTETWWQQFLGEAIIGELTGTLLDMIPARLESFADFRARAPRGTVLVGDHARRYGYTPYEGYDSSPRPFLYGGPLPEGIAALERVVRVGAEAWSLDLVRREGEIVHFDLRLAWSPGQASAVDSKEIAAGRDVGSVVVQRRDGDGAWQDIPYSVDFAFAFTAFYPDGMIHTSACFSPRRSWPPRSDCRRGRGNRPSASARKPRSAGSGRKRPPQDRC